MPRLFSSQRLTATIAATLATGAVAIVPASAETRIETVLGTVTKSDPIRTSYIRKTPSDEKVCETQEVPVYGQASAGSNNNNSDLGAMIIGGVIGSARRRSRKSPAIAPGSRSTTASSRSKRRTRWP